MPSNRCDEDREEINDAQLILEAKQEYQLWKNSVASFANDMDQMFLSTYMFSTRLQMRDMRTVAYAHRDQLNSAQKNLEEMQFLLGLLSRTWVFEPAPGMEVEDYA